MSDDSRLTGDESLPAGPVRPPRSALTVALVVAAVVVAVDQATKEWALAALDDGNVIDVIGSLRFNLHFNTGFAFSTGEGFGWAIGLAGIVISAVLVVWLRQLPTLSARLAGGLVLGGAIGNLIDRTFRADDGFLSGAVVDFIDLQWWPIFNIADSAIVIGVVWLLFALGRSSDAAVVEGDTDLRSDAAVVEGDAGLTTDAAVVEGDADLRSDAAVVEGDAGLTTDVAVVEDNGVDEDAGR